MSNSTGAEYYLKSMNGIKSFDDGSGTVIEDDTITCATINCQTFSADYLNALNNITGLNITASDSMMALTITTDDLIVNDAATLKGTTQVSDLEINNTCRVAQIIPPRFISDVGFWKDVTIPIYFGKFIFSNFDILASDITQPVNLFTNTLAGITLGRNIVVDGTIIKTTAPTSTHELFTDLTTGGLRIGHSLTSGTCAIANNKTSGEVNIMNNLPSSGNINMGDNMNGAINMVRNSTTTGHVNIANTFKIWRNNFENYNLSPTFNFCNNLTNGTTMNIGGLGTVKICNVFSFKGYDIVSSGINDTINLFNNIQTGIVNFCYGLTTAGTLQLGPCKIRHGGTNYYGYSRFVYVTANATITLPININYYVVVGGSTASTITLPNYIINQLIVIRSTKSLVVNVTVNAAAGDSILVASGATATTYAFSRNVTTSFYCDGTKWYVM
jgi:hypothetical protein